MSFIHLHNHSDYSLLDGAIKVEQLVQQAKAYGMPAVALTDHGNIYGAIDFYQQAVKTGIKPIIGIETYLSADDDLPKEGGQPLMFHLVLLAKDKTGFQNLMILSSKAFTEGFYYKPRITRKWLEEYHKGLVCLSACAHGEPAHHLNENNYLSAKEAALYYQRLFGEDYYLEVQDHRLPVEDRIRPGLFQLGRELGIKIVATNDSHYLMKEHSKSHDILLCIGTGKDLNDKDRLKYETEQLYLKTEAEMRALFPENPEIFDNTEEVSDKCNLTLSFDEIHLPKFPLPETADKGMTEDEYLEANVWQGAECRYGKDLPDTIKERIKYEISVIKRMGFSGYFLITKDFTDFARSNSIAVGPARGSAAGSIVAYCLGITNLDPLQYDLLFERFLNPDRVSMPDIDIDFADDRRDEVIKYVRQKYGEENVAQIITFGKMMARAVVRDVGRVMGFTYGEIDKIAKMIPTLPGMTLTRALKENPELQQLIDANPAYQEMMKHCLTLEGLNRHPGIHAAGVVITPDKLVKYVPLNRSAEGEITTQWQMNFLENIGLLKMDFLGLKTLTVIENTLKLLRKRGVEIDLNTLPLDDRKTFELFQEGRTVGVFQFESTGMRENLIKLRPERLEDLIAMNALYRPGPMQFIDDFIRRKHGQEKIVYPHEGLKEILEETYGIIVYQEQVMGAAHKLGGFSLAKADKLRKAMGKKKIDQMKVLGGEFIQGMVEKGIEKKQAQEIYELIEKFAEYGFNKSHSAGYALVAYQTAYLKAQYPAEFMAATMNSEMGRDTARFMILVDECKKLGVEVLPPDVNESEMGFTVAGGKIRFGLLAIKNVGENPVKSILEARERVGKFANVYDFITEADQGTVNRKALESLIKAGALDSMEPNRARLFAVIDSIIAYGNALRDDKSKGQFSIFDTGEATEVSLIRPELPVLDDWRRLEKLGFEKEILGFYISGHPLDKYRTEVASFAHPTLGGLQDTGDNVQVRLCGIITGVKRQQTKKGDMMAIVQLEDFTGSTELLVFSKALEECSAVLQADRMVMVTGRTSTKEEEAAKVIVEKVFPLEKAREMLTKSLMVMLDTKELEAEHIRKLEKLAGSHQGNTHLNFIVYSGGESVKLRSTKYMVSLDDRFLKDLEDLLGKNRVRLAM